MDTFLIWFCNYLEDSETLQFIYDTIASGTDIDYLMENLIEKYPEFWLKSFDEPLDKDDMEDYIIEAGATWRVFLMLN